jgi:hypothetical protein
MDMIGTATVAVGPIAAKRSDFGRFLSGSQNADHAERRTKGERSAVAKDLANGFWRGVGGDVKIFGWSAQQTVTDAATGEVGDETGGLQSSDDRQSICGGGNGEVKQEINSALGVFKNRIGRYILGIGSE